MEKNKYQRLSKEEKKSAREAFYKTEFGATLKPRFNRLLVIGILLIIYSAVFIIEGIIEDLTIWTFLAAGIILIFAIVFLIGRHRLIVSKVNNYLIKKK